MDMRAGACSAKNHQETRLKPSNMLCASLSMPTFYMGADTNSDVLSCTYTL